MSVQGRINELSSRHSYLDETISNEEKRPAKDPLRITELKRQKLRIKEELSNLRNQKA